MNWKQYLINLSVLSWEKSMKYTIINNSSHDETQWKLRLLYNYFVFSSFVTFFAIIHGFNAQKTVWILNIYPGFFEQLFFIRLLQFLLFYYLVFIPKRSLHVCKIGRKEFIQKMSMSLFCLFVIEMCAFHCMLLCSSKSAAKIWFLLLSG